MFSHLLSKGGSLWHRLQEGPLKGVQTQELLLMSSLVSAVIWRSGPDWVAGRRGTSRWRSSVWRRPWPQTGARWREQMGRCRHFWKRPSPDSSRLRPPAARTTLTVPAGEEGGNHRHFNRETARMWQGYFWFGSSVFVIIGIFRCFIFNHFLKYYSKIVSAQSKENGHNIIFIVSTD